MGRRSLNNLRFTRDHLEAENSTENSIDSLCSDVHSDNKNTYTSSSRRSTRATGKRVITVPIKDLEGFRVNGDHMTMSAPPCDSWTWRKYGQKPIKGSPYPRGYYRCSSSKGCPARKQVERSRMDPNMFVVTYSCEHNHLNSKNHNSKKNRNIITTTNTNLKNSRIISTTISTSDEDEEVEEKKPVINHQPSREQVQADSYKFTHTSDGTSPFDYLFDFESTCSTMLEYPVLTEDECNTMDDDMVMIFALREEDESFFADLEELPECSSVFRRVIDRREVAEQRQHSLETTS